MIIVSALVSTYNAQRLLAGRLQNLFATHLWARGALEVIVIDSGSLQDERGVVEALRPTLSEDANARLVYMRTKREPLYCAWNRALQLARGTYVTNANTDDRLAPDALTILVDAVETMRQQDPRIIGAYGDCLVTSTYNAEWGQEITLRRSANYPEGMQRWPDATPDVLVQRCTVGNCPVWLKRAHEVAGVFDESYTVAGDYEMWLRFARHGMRFAKVERIVGLFYESDDQLSNAASSVMQFETLRARMKHKEAVLRAWT